MIPYPTILSELPVTHIEPLDDTSVRFAVAPRETPLRWSMLLDDAPALDRLEPDAPNRAAVAHNFERMRRMLREGYELGREDDFLAGVGVADLASWRDALVEHFCRPAWLYSNAQRWFSLVVTPDARYRVLELASFYSLEVFSTPYFDRLPDPFSAAVFGHLDAAESHVLDQLSTLEMRTLPIRRGERRRSLLLQPAGARRGSRGNRVRLFIAHVDGRAALLETDSGGRDPYTALNRISELLGEEFKDDVIETCATCASFRFTGMSRDMSGGQKGYCVTLRDAAQRERLAHPEHPRRPSYRETVSVFDRCRAYSRIVDEDREIQYCRPRGDEREP